MGVRAVLGFLSSTWFSITTTGAGIEFTVTKAR